MRKWYEDASCDEGIIIGGQVCIVRNIAGYPFASKMTALQQHELIGTVCHAVKACEADLQKSFSFIDLSSGDGYQRKAYIGKLAVPPNMIEDSHQCGLMLSEDESVSILIGGREHICIQVSVPGQHIQEAYEMAGKVDDGINRYLEYAFSSKYGYLMGSPFMVGTGLSVSYLLHLPYLEKKGMIGRFQKEYGQYGYSLNPQFRSSQNVVGSIFRLKNRKTLGLSEHEVISTLKHLTAQVVGEEEKAASQVFETERLAQEDRMFRSYGMLRYARVLDCEETINYLSGIRVAHIYGVWENKDPAEIFKTMLMCQTALLSERDEKEYSEDEAELIRAEFIHEKLKDICGDL